MKTRTLATFLLLASAAFAQSAPTGAIPPDVLEDMTAGGWAGQMIGVSFGAPTEFR